LGGDGVLYRNNFLSRAFEETLMRAKIPYRLVGDVGFYARAEIKDALALLRLAAMPDDRLFTRPFGASSTNRDAASAPRPSKSSNGTPAFSTYRS
jgi:superfamily I DNA/RNA helicase